MARQIESNNENKERILRLTSPSLEDVRRFEVGKFFKGGARIKGSVEIKSIREIKSLVHPKWFEENAYTKSEKWSISQKVYELIKNDKKASRRWRTTKQWIKKENSNTGKGYWAKRIRTPKKSHWKWVPYSQLTEEQKGKPGRRAGGQSYKIRREIWKLLSAPILVLNLLKEEDLSDIERGPIYKTKNSNGVPITIPHLETALREMLEKEIWPKLGSQKMRIAKGWCEHPNVKNCLDSEKKNGFISGKLNLEDELEIIHLICEKSWRVILTNWLELKIFSENLVKDREAIYPTYAKQNASVDTDKGVCRKVIVQDDRCECLYWIRAEDEKEIWCGTCGVIIGMKISIREEIEKREWSS